MFSAEYLGFVAGGLIACSMIPQLTRIFKLKSAREISVIFTSLFLLGITCWLIYGIILSLLPVILWNAVMFVIFSILLYAKLKYGK